MKFIQPYKIFESKESDLMREDILDIFLDISEDDDLSTTVYCTDTIVMICIKRSPTYKYSAEHKPFSGSLIKPDVERVINYLDDKVLSVGYTYAEKKWNATIPTDTIPEGEIYELNVEIRLKKIKEIEKKFSDRTRTNESKERKEYMYQIADILADIFDDYNIVKLNNNDLYSRYNHYQFNDYSFRIFLLDKDNTYKLSASFMNEANEIYDKILSMKSTIESITDKSFNIYRTGVSTFSSSVTIYIKPILESIKESNETDDVNDMMMMLGDFEDEYDWMKADAQTNDGKPHIRFYKNFNRGSVNLQICYDKVNQILSQFPEYEVNACFFRYDKKSTPENKSINALVCLFKNGSDLKNYRNEVIKMYRDKPYINIESDRVDNILNYKYKPYNMLTFELSRKKKETLIDKFKKIFAS